MGNGFTFCIAWFFAGHQTEKWREVHGGRWGVHALFIKGVIMIQERCAVMGYVVQRVLSQFPPLQCRGGTSGHGNMCGILSCGYSGTSLARVKLFE